jgi:hypothetical protein
MSGGRALAERPAPISFEPLGTAAGGQCQGDALSVTATPDGARLRCGFQKLEGRASAEGLWLESTALGGGKLRVVAQAVGREVLEGGTPLPLWKAAAVAESGKGLPQSTTLARRGTISVEDKLVRFLRPGLTEEYSVSVDGVRQDSVLATRPAGEGLLRVELAVDGAVAGPMAGGAQLVLVADADAAYPLRIDPTFSDANWISRKGSNRRLVPADSEAVWGCFRWFSLLDLGRLSRHAGTMPRAMRVEYPGSIYDVMDRGDRREDILI